MSDTTPDQTPAPDQTPDPTPDPKAGEGGDKGPDLAAIVATLTAQVAELTAEKTRATEAAEAARVASLSEAERVAEERKALDAEKKGLVMQARQAAADKLGILPKALPLIPDVDPRTPEGAKAFEAFAKENPEFLKPANSAPNPLVDLANSAKGRLADVLSGKVKNPLITPESLKKMYG